MKLNRSSDLSRRAFLRRSGQLALSGIATPWAVNLASMGEAAAFTATDYKALVCVFLYGGNDHGNTFVPYDTTNYNAYKTIRVGIATPQSDLAGTVLVPKTALPNGLQLALAPQMTGLKGLFDAGKLAVQLNVGTLIQPTTYDQYVAKSVPLPPKLFSHNDQQSVWQSSSPEGAVTGWGGRIGDLAMASNTDSVFTCISATGSAVYVAGQTAVQYQVSTSGAVPITGIKSSLYGSSSCSAALQTLITQASSQTLENELVRVTSRSIAAESKVSTALAAVPAFSQTFPTTTLASQLQMVAKLIAARGTLGAKRQVFMVSLGGFDLHDYLPDKHPGLLTDLSQSLTAFYNTIDKDLGLANQVTAFTASDFGRTYSSNGDGSDHGWGSHHVVMGGAVKGGQFYGTAPSIAVNTKEDVGQGRLIPTTSVDQFAATLATWFGVSSSELRTVVPNIGNYTTQNVGFV